MKKCPKCGADYPDTTTLCPSDGVALEKTDDSLLGQTLAGKYRIEERLSEGGMGTVYRGTHVLMEKTVAIKVLRSSLAADEKIVARFSREARAASRISHPHALSVTDFGESEDGVVFLVMEYLSGRTLKELIRQEGPMPLAQVVDIMRQVGGALDAAHAQGVVHRDLKSDNIMLLSSIATDYAKVLDFGIAKIKEREGEYDPGLTAPDLVIGTPQYMSPEQCSQAADIDARSDIYSLGIILYEMLVGHVPFTGPSSTSIMLKQLQEPAPDVLEERSDLPPAIGRVVARAMAKLADNRYQRVLDLVEDLVIAAGIEGAEISPATASGERPAVPDPAAAASVPLVDEPDEITVVHPRAEAPSPVRHAPSTVRIPTAYPRSALNPWKIMVPAAAALLVVFAVIYAFTRNSATNTTNSTEPSLMADPNSQPVVPATPATGQGEAGIPAGGGTTNQPASTNVNASPSPSPVEELTPSVNANVEANANANQANTNSKPAPSVVLPTPKPVNANAEPPPTPQATKPPLPKPTQAAPTGTPETPTL